MVNTYLKHTRIIVMNENNVFLNIINREGQLILKTLYIKKIWLSKTNSLSCFLLGSVFLINIIVLNIKNEHFYNVFTLNIEETLVQNLKNFRNIRGAKKIRTSRKFQTFSEKTRLSQKSEIQ